MIEHRHSRVRSHACVRLDPSSTAKGEIATRTRNSRRPRAPGSRNFQRAHTQKTTISRLVVVETTKNAHERAFVTSTINRAREVMGDYE